MADEVTELPMEIIHEILAWLPVKPLCRFRCVSKSWNSLTFDPKFVKLHFNKALEHHHVLHERRRVLVTHLYTGVVYSLNLDEFLNRDDIDQHELLVTEMDRVVYVPGSSVFYSNALLLFKLDESLTLLNPVTRESRVVPEFPRLGPWNRIYGKLYGFGFDPSTQDYKVVYGVCGDCNTIELKFSVYSLRSGSWRVIEKGCPYQSLDSGIIQGRLLNGSIHWLVYRDYNDESSIVLLSFVLAEEEVREIPLPPRFHIEGEDVWLSIFRDCLCMILGYNEEVWVMKEYGVRESWTKIRISIPPCQWVHSGFRKKHYDLLQLEECENKLVLLNFEHDTFHNISIRGVPEVGYVAVYLESLISPNLGFRSTEEVDEVTELPNLPMEIIREILAWLPVKPLCKFRCVSKSWNSLTFDSEFVKLHFNKALEHKEVFYQRRRVLVSDVNSGKFYSFNLDEFLNHDDTDNVVENPELLVTQVDTVGDLSGCYVFHSNALMLFQSKEKFSLLNPVTRELKLVPEFPMVFKSRPFVDATLYGFGFDMSTQDYKMVYGVSSKMELKFSVYSLKTGLWRVIEKGYPYQSLSYGMQARLLNGGLHWLVYRNRRDASSMVLLSFVLAEEEVREIPLPPCFHIEGEECCLSIFRDCLCMILGYNEEVWVMKEYGVRDSWTKIKISIPPCQWVHSGFRKRHYDLLQLEECENKLVLLNFDEDTSRSLSIHGVPEIGYVVVYLESLVSPNHFSITD